MRPLRPPPRRIAWAELPTSAGGTPRGYGRGTTRRDARSCRAPWPPLRIHSTAGAARVHRLDELGVRTEPSDRRRQRDRPRSLACRGRCPRRAPARRCPRCRCGQIAGDGGGRRALWWGVDVNVGDGDVAVAVGPGSDESQRASARPTLSRSASGWSARFRSVGVGAFGRFSSPNSKSTCMFCDVPPMASAGGAALCCRSRTARRHRAARSDGDPRRPRSSRSRRGQ